MREMAARLRRWQMDGWYKYVLHRLVVDYEHIGWRVVADLGPPHNHYSVLMQWFGDGEPVMPGKKTPNA